MTENVYLEEIKKFFPNYGKRELLFELTQARIESAFEKLKEQNKVKSSFLSFIEELLSDGCLLWRDEIGSNQANA